MFFVIPSRKNVNAKKIIHLKLVSKKINGSENGWIMVEN